MVLIGNLATMSSADSAMMGWVVTSWSG
jgi:hypothetical protein